MKSKTAKTILISLLISLILIAGASAVILFVLLPQGIISQEWLYHFFISAIPAFAVALLLAIALLWIEHSISSSKAELAEYDSEEIEPGTYDESLQDMPFDSDYSMDSSAVPNDWEYVEEFDSLPKKEQDEIAEKLPEEPEAEKELAPFGEFEFDIPSAPIKFKELSAATAAVNFAFHKDTMERPEGEMYIAPTKEQIARGEFVMHLAPTKAVAFGVDPSDAFNALSAKFPKVLHEFDEFIFDIPEAPKKKEVKELSAAKSIVDFTWNKDTMKRPEGEMYIAPTKEQIERGEFIMHLAPTKAVAFGVDPSDAFNALSAKFPKVLHEFDEFIFDIPEAPKKKEVKELSAAKSIVDFTWNKDTMKRPEGEMYIAPTKEQIARGEFAFALSPVKADADTPSPKAVKTDDEEEDDKNGSAFEGLATLEETVNAEYDIAPKESDELQSEEQVISYEKDSDANIAYPSLPLPEDVESTEEEELLEQQEKENNVYTGDFYIETPLPQDQVNANDAYDYLSTPYGDEKPEHIDTKTNEPKEAKEVKELSAAKSIVDFTWNKDTMKRPEGEMYIAPTQAQIERGEFVFALSPVKANADTPSPKAEQTDDEEEDDKNGSAFEGLATLEETVNAEYDIAPKETDELQSEEQVISYEKDSDANIAYPSLPLPEDVESTYDDEEELLEQQEKENNVYTGDFYIETPLPQDEVSANDAYDYLSTPYGDEKPEHIETKEVKELSAAKSIVDFTWNKDAMKRPEGEMYIAPTKEQIARGEFAFALSPVKETTALAHRAPSDVALADTNKGIAVADTNKGVATLESEVSKAYGSLSLPDDVDESEDDEVISEAEKANAESNFVYVPHATVKDGAKHSDAYNALMSLRAEQSANPETFSEEFSSILELEMESARQLNYELTIARVTSEKTDDIMKLDFEALAFKESDNRICMIFQCQNKQEASALLNMIKEVIQDKSMRIRMAELRGRNIDAAAFSKEILR